MHELAALHALPAVEVPAAVVAERTLEQLDPEPQALVLELGRELEVGRGRARAVRAARRRCPRAPRRCHSRRRRRRRPRLRPRRRRGHGGQPELAPAASGRRSADAVCCHSSADPCYLPLGGDAQYICYDRAAHQLLLAAASSWALLPYCGAAAADEEVHCPRVAPNRR